MAIPSSVSNFFRVCVSPQRQVSQDSGVSFLDLLQEVLKEAQQLFLPPCQCAQQNQSPAPQPPACPSSPAEKPAAAADPSTESYTVQKGDTIYHILRKKGFTLQDIHKHQFVAFVARSSHLENPDCIQPGQVLQLPKKDQPPPATASSPHRHHHHRHHHHPHQHRFHAQPEKVVVC